MILTGIGRGKQIVPPLYMQLVAFGLLAYYTMLHPIPDPAFALYVLLLYAIGAGSLQDRVVLWTLGRYAPRDQIVPFCLRVAVDVDAIKNVLLTPKFRDNLGLRKKVVPIENGYRLRGEDTVKVAAQLERGEQQNETYINLAFYF
jgi:hypothetical protein